MVSAPSRSLASLAGAAAIVVVLLLVFDPFWETNDDVAMSMMAHGYGIAAYASQFLLFSNVLWGRLVSSLPILNGVLPYSWITLTALSCCAWAALHVTERLRLNRWLALLAVALAFARPIAYPQFTIVAGMLTAIAMLGWCAYGRTRDPRLLLLAGTMAFAGFLIRYDEFFFIVLVGSPLLVSRVLWRDRRFLACVGALAILIAAAALWNDKAYQRPEWEAYDKVNSIRAPFTDYGAFERVAAQPQIARKSGFSLNDLELVRRWFFADLVAADPARLESLVRDLAETRTTLIDRSKVFRAALSLRDPAIFYLCCAALALSLMMRPGWRVAASWALFLAVITAIGMLGRAGQIRVYYPAICLFLFAALTLGRPLEGSGWKRPRLYLAIAVICAAGIASLSILESANRASALHSRAVREDVAQMDHGELFVIWGANFPFEAANPVLLRTPREHDIRMYALGVSSLAPFAMAQWQRTRWRSLVEQLLSATPVPLIAGDRELLFLREYCREHHRRALTVERVQKLRTFEVDYVSCGRAA